MLRVSLGLGTAAILLATSGCTTCNSYDSWGSVWNGGRQTVCTGSWADSILPGTKDLESPPVSLVTLRRVDRHRVCRSTKRNKARNLLVCEFTECRAVDRSAGRIARSLGQLVSTSSQTISGTCRSSRTPVVIGRRLLSRTIEVIVVVRC